MSSAEIERLRKQLGKLKFEDVAPPPADPVEFCKVVLGFAPTPYQKSFLEDQSKRIALLVEAIGEEPQHSGEVYCVQSSTPEDPDADRRSVSPSEHDNQ